MARSRKSKKKNRTIARWLFRLIALVVLGALGFAIWFWWDMRSWRPDDTLYPEHGAVVTGQHRGINFTTLKAVGAQFVYLRLDQQRHVLDDEFAKQFSDAIDAGLKVGVLLPFNPCLPADPQSAFFTQMVPRERNLLSPAIALTHTASGCEPAVSDAAVESELTTLVNQIELHAGKPVVLKLGPEFEARHNTARSTARDLWLERDRARPAYADRPWLLWSANSQLVTEASERPVEWVVVQR